ncbi:hypothetical protein ACFYWP_36735 [Actinacidiphila glaucinigra]|uniref:hypothetical protein n=1 Tax=Actinacidiphila glaucinigra TaxID=235986 RepID=UPI0036A11941
MTAISTRPAAEGETMGAMTDNTTPTDEGGRVRVRVVLLFGDQAEIAADADDANAPERYLAADVAAAVGLEPKELPGKRPTARVGAGHRLEGFRLA